ncbi:MAG TPA: succinate dehydrogenase cytochrome b subunit [Acidobacteriota bacterium]|nr:succinate dehydrogenase cytochrome b subunit [Acidobacteriota bacterium]
MLSTTATKFLMAFTGLALFLFIVGHLAGNLLLLAGPDSFNSYSHTLLSMGWLLYAVEAGLIVFFAAHVVSGVSIVWKNRGARGNRYQTTRSRGEPSRMNFSSRSMIWTGLVLLVFTIVHLQTFKFGPAEAEGYLTTVDGVVMRDLYRLVVEVFSNEVYVVGYVAAMVLLGLHLRHGFWSAFQSLGAHHPRITPILYGFGAFTAALLAIGFLFLPIWIYLTGV